MWNFAIFYYKYTIKSKNSNDFFIFFYHIVHLLPEILYLRQERREINTLVSRQILIFTWIGAEPSEAFDPLFSPDYVPVLIRNDAVFRINQVFVTWPLAHVPAKVAHEALLDIEFNHSPEFSANIQKNPDKAGFSISAKGLKGYPADTRELTE